MKRIWLSAALGAMAVLGAPAAQAGPIWSLDVVFGTKADISNTGRSVVLFTSSNTTSSSLVATPVIAKITERSWVSAAHPDPITNQNYGFYLKLTDLASHASRSLWFAGSLSGSLSATSSNLTNRFLTATSYSNIHLGHDVYSISFGPMVLPSAKNHFQGSLSVKVVDPPDQGPVNATPEPASLTLAGMGLALAGLGACWRRRGGRS